MRSRKTINRKKTSKNNHSLPSRTNQTTLEIQKQITSKPKTEWTIDRLTTTYVPSQIVGREKEKLVIDSFVQNCLMNRIGSKVLYISGIPGVGKTASTMQILKKLQTQSKNKVNIGFINALTLKKPDQVYRLMLSIITGGQDKQQSKRTISIVKKIEEVLPTLSKPHIIVIDEVDYLLTKDQTIFYNLFEWVYQVTAKLGLIIIANTMDFPQKLSGKVNSRMGNNRLVFKPYSYQQIKAIIQERLDDCKLFTANALVFAAKKLSTYSSDIRTILQVLYKAVQNHIQNETKGKIKIEQIVALWDKKVSQGNAFSKHENLTDLHNQILEYLRKHDNQCNSRDALDVFIQKGVKPHNFVVLLKQLEEMNYITMAEQRSSMFPNYILRLVQTFKI